MDHKKDDNSDGGVKDGNIDPEVDGNTWEEVLKKTWSAVSPTADQKKIVGKWFAIL